MDPEDAPSETNTAQEKRRAQIATWLQEGKLDDPPGPPNLTLPHTYILSTDTPHFLRWLKSTTRGAERHKFHTPKGYFTLQQAREQDHTGQTATDVPILTIDGLFHEPSGGVFLYPRVIFFSVTTLADGRIAVQANCEQEGLADYYNNLLEQLAQHWSP